MTPRSERPHSLLFLSCDLVGSTQFKQKKRGPTDAPWQKQFLSFYREFPQYVAKATFKLNASQDRPLGEFTLWKPVGDELIYTVEVKEERDVANAVRIWLDAMKAYEDDVLISSGLATKGGAFIATFPGPDSQATIPRTPESETSDEDVIALNRKALTGQRVHKKYLYDYFGPSIDTGFRVLGVCTRRNFTLSVEVAWAIALCRHTPHFEDTHLNLEDLVLHTTVPLKGVWEGKGYPVFAIDREAHDPVNLAMSKITNGALLAVDVIKLCSACHGDPAWPSALYLPDSSVTSFGTIPTDPLAAFDTTGVKGYQEKNTPEIGDDLVPSPPLG